MYRQSYLLYTKYLCTIILIVGQYSALQSQNDIVKNLRAELSAASHDTSIIQISRSLSFQLKDIHPDSSLLLCLQSTKLLYHIFDPTSRFEALRRVGLCFQTLNQLDSAMVYLTLAHEQANQNEDHWRQGIILNNLGGLYRLKKQLKLALDYFKNALKINQRINDKSGQTVNLNNMAIVYMEQKLHSNAIESYERALELQNELGNKEYEAGIAWNIGLAYKRNQQFENAIPYFKRAIQLKAELEDLEGQSSLLQALAGFYESYSHIPQALELYQKAAENWKLLGNKRNVARSLAKIGSAYSNYGDLLDGIDVLNESIILYAELKDSSGLCQTYNTLGYNYKEQEEFNQALATLYKATEVCKGAKNKRIAHYPLRYIGAIYIILDQLDSANHYLQLASKKAELFGSNSLRFGTAVEFGRLYKKQDQPQKAKEILEQAISSYKGNSYLNKRMNIYYQLYEINKTLGNTLMALKHLEQYNALKNQYNDEENTKAYARFTAQYEFDKEKEQIAKAQEKEVEGFMDRLRRQRTIQAIIGIILFLTLISAFILARYYKLKQRANKKLQFLNEELSTKNTLVARQKEDLAALNQAKTKLYTNITHEFRTPLTVISGVAQQIKGNTQQKEMIQRNSGQLLNLVNQMLDLRKLESGAMMIQKQQADIVQYLRYLTHSFQGLAASHNLSIHFISVEEQIMMDFDPEKITRIHSNLLSNALKFTPEGGHIYIQLATIHSGLQRELRYTVRDTGIGIPEDKHAQIFDRFYQVDDSSTRDREGTGIGLTLVSELVQAMEGTISVHSKPGSGTTFKVKLPITNIMDKAEVETLGGPIDASVLHLKSIPDPKMSVEIVSGKPTILIVEDNVDVIHYLTTCLKDEYHIEIAMNGADGIEQALEDIPDLIVSDVMMPIKDGFELCETLKTDERTSHIPIVLLTAKADIESRMEGLTRGADAYLNKPFHQEELLQILRNQLALRQALQLRLLKFQDQDSSVSLHDLASNQKHNVQEHLEIEDAFLQKIRTIVEQDLSNHEITMPQLMRSLKMSRSQIYKKVKALTGLSPSKYIRSIRLYHAKQLLSQKELNVSEVAYETGFSSPTYFSDVFFEEFGSRPNQTRT